MRHSITENLSNRFRLIVLRDDGPELDLGWPPGWDLGYPATVEMEPGELLTVYYQIDPPDHKPSIQATRWSLG